jgi:16S rRNA (cytosine967-C5)-methyltransferase
VAQRVSNKVSRRVRASRPVREPAGLAARRIAVDIVADTLAGRQALDAAIDAEHGHAGLAGLETRDRGFVKALVTGTFRRRGQILDALTRYLDRPLPRSAGRTGAILEVAAFQILFLDTAAHAAVDTAVTLAAEDRSARHFKGLVNAVLRRLATARADVLALQDPIALNTPAWLASRWQTAYGEATARAIAAIHLEEPPLDLTVRGDAAEWAARLGGSLLPTGTVRLSRAGEVGALAGYAEGAWWIQDAAAALPARLLGDVSGMRVADLCAAPGGKTAQLAAAGARVVALDRSVGRLERLKANLRRLGLAAETVVADATAWQTTEPFDAVLLDAPCSATGTLRRHPDIAWRRRDGEIARLAGLQARLLDRAAALLRPGGVLVYATCSLEPEEGEAQVAALLTRDASLIRRPVQPGEIPGLEGLLTPAGDLRTLPCGPADGHFPGGLDGFYAARLVRPG